MPKDKPDPKPKTESSSAKAELIESEKIVNEIQDVNRTMLARLQHLENCTGESKLYDLKISSDLQTLLLTQQAMVHVKQIVKTLTKSCKLFEENPTSNECKRALRQTAEQIADYNIASEVFNYNTMLNSNSLHSKLRKFKQSIEDNPGKLGFDSFMIIPSQWGPKHQLFAEDKKLSHKVREVLGVIPPVIKDANVRNRRMTFVDCTPQKGGACSISWKISPPHPADNLDTLGLAGLKAVCSEKPGSKQIDAMLAEFTHQMNGNLEWATLIASHHSFKPTLPKAKEKLSPRVSRFFSPQRLGWKENWQQFFSNKLVTELKKQEHWKNATGDEQKKKLEQVNQFVGKLLDTMESTQLKFRKDLKAGHIFDKIAVSLLNQVMLAEPGNVAILTVMEQEVLAKYFGSLNKNEQTKWGNDIGRHQNLKDLVKQLDIDLLIDHVKKYDPIHVARRKLEPAPATPTKVRPLPPIPYENAPPNIYPPISRAGGKVAQKENSPKIWGQQSPTFSSVVEKIKLFETLADKKAEGAASTKRGSKEIDKPSKVAPKRPKLS